MVPGRANRRGSVRAWRSNRRRAKAGCGGWRVRVAGALEGCGCGWRAGSRSGDPVADRPGRPQSGELLGAGDLAEHLVVVLTEGRRRAAHPTVDRREPERQRRQLGVARSAGGPRPRTACGVAAAGCAPCPAPRSPPRPGPRSRRAHRRPPLHPCSRTRRRGERRGRRGRPGGRPRWRARDRTATSGACAAPPTARRPPPRAPPTSRRPRSGRRPAVRRHHCGCPPVRPPPRGDRVRTPPRPRRSARPRPWSLRPGALARSRPADGARASVAKTACTPASGSHAPRTRTGGPSGEPGPPREAGDRLHGLRETGPIAPRTVEAEGGHAHEDDRGVHVVEAVPAESELLHDPGGVVLDHCVCGGDQPLEHGDALRVSTDRA